MIPNTARDKKRKGEREFTKQHTGETLTFVGRASSMSRGGQPQLGSTLQEQLELASLGLPGVSSALSGQRQPERDSRLTYKTHQGAALPKNF